MTRRTFAGSTAATAFFGGALSGALAANQTASVFAYVGCYTTAQRKGRGDGIHVYRVDPRTGAWTQTQVLTGLVNPSFLQMGIAGKFLYSSHGDEEYATSYSIDPTTGNIKVLNQAKTGGKNGAHMAISPNGQFAVVGNYTAGSVAVLPIQGDGTLGDFTQLVPMEGTPGPHRTEQPGPHPHQIVFDPSGRYVLVPDKGLDRIFVFRFDSQAGKLTPASFVETRAGAGPRHLAFHPTLPVVWVLNELGNTVTTYSWDARNAVLKALQTVSSLPQDFSANNTAAEIVVGPGGRFLYASNRGHDSVVTFAVDAKTGLLRASGWTPAGGKVPRFITVGPNGRSLFVTNEQSDTIVKLRIDGASLAPEGPPIANASPVTIAFRDSR
ncbi:MAG: putative hemagglutinin-related protein [Bryobacterales bacterium]|nr:putative hemagglutinin-related protein [Bryobacterales bacterium]